LGTTVIGILVSFAIGFLASLAASWVVVFRERARFRVRFRAILNLVIALAKSIQEAGYQPDYIVTIDRNGTIVGSILSGYMGLKSVISVTTITQRMPHGARVITLDEVSASCLPNLKGRRLLIVTCCNDSGASLEYVYQQLSSLSEPPSEIRSAALYTTYSPSFRPTYAAVVIGRDTKQTTDQILLSLPWMTSGWQRVHGL
jgi:hypoxanthine phosphoribosyltransferase